MKDEVFFNINKDLEITFCITFHPFANSLKSNINF